MIKGNKIIKENNKKNGKQYNDKRNFNEYKHLSYKDKLKVNRQRRWFKYLGKFIRRVSTLSFAIVLFMIGFTAFYIWADSKGEIEQDGNVGFYESKNDDARYSEGVDKELEKSLEERGEEVSDENKETDDGERNENSDGTQSSNEHEDANDVKELKGLGDLKELKDFSEWNEKCPPELVIVNGQNKLDKNYNVDIKVCRGKEIGILAWENLEKMIQDAAKEGMILWISSGYRSVKYQDKLFNNQVERELNKGVTLEKAIELAQTVVAKPGMSEHNTGLAVDFNGVRDDFYKTKEYKWLMDNATRYGFIERYQKKWMEKTGVIYEPWHFRYVGSYAQSIKESNLCLEDWVQQNLGG